MAALFAFLLSYCLQTAHASLENHNVTIEYDNLNKNVIITLIVPKDQWFALGFGSSMTDAGAILFQGGRE
jgi:hypothetical protein